MLFSDTNTFYEKLYFLNTSTASLSNPSLKHPPTPLVLLRLAQHQSLVDVSHVSPLVLHL